MRFLGAGVAALMSVPQNVPMYMRYLHLGLEHRWPALRSFYVVLFSLFDFLPQVVFMSTGCQRLCFDIVKHSARVLLKSSGQKLISRNIAAKVPGQVQQ
eukprot:1264093-Amphidinium_carterae.1